MGVSENIAARMAAEQVAELADDEAKVHGRVFWKQLHQIVCAHVPCRIVEETKSKTMTDEEAKRFGNQLMPYGEYKGKRVDDVPLSRLEWYADQTFTDEVRRYLRSSRIQREE